MTPDAQRLAIAHACGWTGIYRPDGSGWIGMFGPLRGFMPVPDYLNDLNAMHEAEATLFPVHVHQLSSWDKWARYAESLPHFTVGHAGGPTRATASQRAECFLKTQGLWTP